jgi:hypothetical protein
VYEVQAIELDYEEAFAEISDRMFLSEDYIGNDIDYREKKKEQFVEFYLKELYDDRSVLSDGVPDFFELVNAIQNYNNECIEDIVLLDFEHWDDPCAENTFCTEEVIHSYHGDKNQILNYLLECWNQEFENFTECGLLTEDLVAALAKEMQYGLVINECYSNYYQEMWDDSYKIYVNDCQNVLFPDWQKALYKDYDALPEDEITTTLVLSAEG